MKHNGVSSQKVMTVAFAVWGKESITKTIYKLLLNALKLFAPVAVTEFHTTDSCCNLVLTSENMR
jgi:hypothetical protein